MQSWVFNLTETTNVFLVHDSVLCQPGYLFLYTLIGDGRIAYDASASTISDYKMGLNNAVAKIDSTINLRFNILVQLKSVEKNFNKASLAKLFSYPGQYRIKTWLQDVGTVSNSILWRNGFDYDSTVIYLTVTDGKFIFLNNRLIKTRSCFLIISKDPVISTISCAPLSIHVGDSITCKYDYFAQTLFNILYEVKALNLSSNFTTTGFMMKKLSFDD